MYLFLPIKESLYYPYIEEYKSFGIAVYEYSRYRVEKRGYISDVSVKFDFVNNLCIRYTVRQLRPEHLLDVVIDSI